jgi:phenylacetate-CoA ligase
MTSRDDYFDDREARAPEAREAALFAALPGHLEWAVENAPAVAAQLAGIDPAGVTDRAALTAIPVLRKSELIKRQRAHMPLGGLAAVGMASFRHLFSSPGPIYVPQGQRPDHWGIARALHAAGFRPGGLIHNTFSYHFSPGAWIMESGAQALGCPVFPGGVGQTELQVRTIEALRPPYFTGTPSFLEIILAKGREMGADLSSMAAALVGGEAFPPSLQKKIAGHGIDAYQCYATADLGLIAYESPAREGLILNEGIIVEIVRPGTGDPVAEGEVGEVVVTTFVPEYPLIRFATGDLSAILAGRSPCGRTAARIKGWMGRADQTTKVRGLFVHPQQIAALVARHPEVLKARLSVTGGEGGDVMTLACEAEDGGTTLEGAIAESIQAVCKLRGVVELVAPGSLPDDGKVIDDLRTYE